MEMCVVQPVLVHRCPAATLFVVQETVAPGDQLALHFILTSSLMRVKVPEHFDVCVCVFAHRCEQCEYESKLYADGQEFSSRTEPCLRCRCSVSSGG